MKKLFLLLSILFLSVTKSYGQGVDPEPWSFMFGYINKGWTTDIDGKSYSENLWGQEGKKLHGIQIGIGYSPTLPIGLGLDTGLYYECFISNSEVVHDYGYDDFTEHNLYIPVHAQFRIPVSPNFSIHPYAGFGMNIVLSGTYNINEYYGGYEYDWWDGGRPYGGTSSIIAGYQSYDEGDWPKSFNFQWEIGAKLKISNFIISAGYAFGVTDHKFYEGYKTKQNKLNISLGYAFGI